MMRQQLLWVTFLIVSCTHPMTVSTTQNNTQAKLDISTILDDWHDAAAKADETRYFAHFAKEAVFLGTDATERWDVAAFRAYAHPYFSQGKGWEFHSIRRDISFGATGIAWFDEDLSTKNMGPARGSGVMIYEENQWKIAQYNLAITIPNDRFGEVKKILENPKPAD
jgi:hypothetical protein